MADGEYTYTKTPVNNDKLTLEIEVEEFSQVLEYINVLGTGSNNLTIKFEADLTAPEKTTLDTVVSGHDGQPPNSYDRLCQWCSHRCIVFGLVPPTNCECCGSVLIISIGETGAKGLTPRVLFPICLGGSTSYARNQTGYMCYHGFYSNENMAKTKFPAGIAKKINLEVSFNSVSDPTVVTLRKNGEDTALTFTIPASTTGVFTATDGVLIGDGDSLNFEIAIGVGKASENIIFKSGTVGM